MKNKLLKRLKVLLVEDEQNLARLLKGAIGDQFHSFTLASDGKEGLELFESIKPDIVITDINMPNMNGLEMAKRLKEIDESINIIILSAFSDKEKLFSAIDVGVTKYFLKPFDPDELLEYMVKLAEKIGDKNIQLIDGYNFNKTTNALYKGNKFIPLSKNELKFINLLLEHRDRVLEDSTIKQSLWQEEGVSDERVRTFIRRLRAKTSKELILNLKGLGYQLAF
jgi:DNA-binding response OmpR family regulator